MRKGVYHDQPGIKIIDQLQDELDLTGMTWSPADNLDEFSDRLEQNLNG
jgi:hypothetical protein